ncbi:MAG: 1,4-dihydroxy-2-naphthoate octaprenyltransferase [Bacteroidetes bacterium 4572_77]|nr:MAG: 1,4-dihydroxy-2-naphthoate octaprenyltransferase [Bacteroidetes bacterium 4572_77]
MRLKIWIQAFRLRTLALALSSIILGAIVSYVYHSFQWQVSALAVLTTLLLQILSNLANDYGDGTKGTDNKDRLGPTRAIQSGEITPAQMKKAIIVFSILSFLSGISLIYISGISLLFAAIMLFIGLLAIVAAVKYTVGKKAYGYSGLGDFFVFVFFGPVAVMGTFYLNAHFITAALLWPSITVGFLSVAVLNLNNMRDFENDIASGKITLAVKLGIKNAKLYHIILVNVAFFSLMYFEFLLEMSWWIHLTFFLYPLFLMDLKKIDQEQNLQNLDPYLKYTALKTLLLVIVFGILVLI